MKYCSQCGRALRDSDKFCGFCGAPSDGVPAGAAVADKVWAELSPTLPHTALLRSPDSFDDVIVRNAIESYADGIEPDDIVAMLDHSAFRNGKKGVIFTRSRIYSTDFEGRAGYADLDDIASAAMNQNHFIRITFRDGRFVNLYSGFSDHVVLFLQEYIRKAAEEEDLAAERPEPVSDAPADTGITVAGDEADDGKNSIYTRARDKFRSGDYTAAFSLFRMAADMGYTGAKKYLGVMYEYGEGVQKDLSNAFYWYKTAAEEGDVFSQSALACLYMTGDGMEPDYDKAYYWAEKSAKAGDADSQYYLGILCVKGLGTPPDRAAGIEWLKKSAAGGKEQAAEMLKKLNA